MCIKNDIFVSTFSLHSTLYEKKDNTALHLYNILQKHFTAKKYLLHNNVDTNFFPHNSLIFSEHYNKYNTICVNKYTFLNLK